MSTTNAVNARVRFGWFMYDWANSAFAMTVLAALFGPYLDKVVVPTGGYPIAMLGIPPLSATSLYGYSLGFSALMVLLTIPLLGAIADFTHAKKRFLRLFCFIGSGTSLLLFFVGPGDVIPALLLFVIANFSFVAGNVFYDAFLPHIAELDEQDEVSGKGYAYGYAGGGLLFLLHLLLIQFHATIGIQDVTLAIRIALGSVGLWWGGFSLITFSRLQETIPTPKETNGLSLLKIGARRISHTVRTLRRLDALTLFLLSFMIYNDGIQTAIAMATMYGSGELHFDTITLMGCLLMVQLVGIFGSRLFAKLATKHGTKAMLLVTLAIWSCVLVYAFGMTKPIEFWILGGIVGLVLGGSQALSRSFFSKIIPANSSSEFFGFFSVFEKFSAIWGPIVFALLRQVTGSSKLSILSLLVFFLVGFAFLLFVNVEKAMQQKKDFKEMESSP